MFWRDHPVVLRRKGKVLIGALALAVTLAITGFVVSVQGHFGAAVLAIVATTAAAATANWAHWAFRDAASSLRTDHPAGRDRRPSIAATQQ